MFCFAYLGYGSVSLEFVSHLSTAVGIVECFISVIFTSMQRANRIVFDRGSKVTNSDFT